MRPEATGRLHLHEQQMDSGRSTMDALPLHTHRYVRDLPTKRFDVTHLAQYQ